MKVYSQQLALTNLSKSDINNVYILAAENLALGKPTYQSSSRSSNDSNRAVNGNLCDFTHTLSNEYPSWWRVDLEERYNIGQIILCNRKDCCSELNNTS